VNWINRRFGRVLDFLYNITSTVQGRILLLSLIVGLTYLPSWLRLMAMLLSSTATTPLVCVGAACLGGVRLWQSRHDLRRATSSSVSRWIGYNVIGFGMVLFPFCQSKTWSQALSWSIILLGLFLSSWGFAFLWRYWLSIFYLLLGIYPSALTVVSGSLLDTLTPAETLEKIMAWAGGGVLQLLRYSVVSDGIYLLLPTGGVSVYEGCTGFDLLVSILCVSLLVGISFALSWTRTFFLSGLGLILAFSLNAIRIALMAVAAAEWGDQAFEFWHGFWGGQIFASLLFTIYYYLIVWMLPKPSHPHPKISPDSSMVQ
jgi:exosortase